MVNAQLDFLVFLAFSYSKSVILVIAYAYEGGLLTAFFPSIIPCIHAYISRCEPFRSYINQCEVPCAFISLNNPPPRRNIANILDPPGTVQQSHTQQQQILHQFHFASAEKLKGSVNYRNINKGMNAMQKRYVKGYVNVRPPIFWDPPNTFLY